MMVLWLEILVLSFFISLPFLYDLSRTFRYYFRLSIFFTLATLTSLLAVFHYNFRDRLITYFGQQISDLLSIEWHLYGEQNLSINCRKIILINGQNPIDALGLLQLIRHQGSELDIIIENNYNNLWPFSFLPWLLSILLNPVNFINENLSLPHFSSTNTKVNIILTSASSYEGRVIISVMPLFNTKSLSPKNILKHSLELSSKMSAEFDCISKITEISDYQTPL
ncbi:uncharacterized protein LOC126903051 isoform X2 [Daktulosphaira vitifoliae]|uniref:uncharacterized protein LOC126903051 isoform X2 n=1 Tax=Daktulosphaira vitifoliae TaxID=58002 RepID=UPI0021AADA9D|nr:uncharacterized protein LOC126903051 isoform X2 [Daktulosphaira vitifoliae]